MLTKAKALQWLATQLCTPFKVKLNHGEKNEILIGLVIMFSTMISFGKSRFQYG